MNIYDAYHATDKVNVNNIITNNFRYTPQNDHWLGNGVYFFLDYSLAEKWMAQKPTSKYGKIEDGAIIKVRIEVDKDFVLDLRNLTDYNRVKNKFEEFWKEINSIRASLTNVSYQKLRCAFFDIVKKQCNCKCIIAYFTERRDLSIHTEFDEEYLNFKIPYIEVQLCVNDVSIIVDRKKFLENEYEF